MTNTANTLNSVTSARRDSVLLNPKELDLERVKQLQEHGELMRVLLKWVLFPDFHLVPQLRELAALIEKLYDFPPKLKAYRGFKRGSHQSCMGLTDDQLDTNKTHSYSHDERGLSFSSDIEIARSYGDTIVESLIPMNSVNALVITDELAFIISDLRSITPETQKEIIVLPPFNINFRIIEHGK